jgi:arylsulfatase
VAFASCDARRATDSSDARPLNVVLFLLDATRADHLGVYGYHRDTTPNIDALAAQGTLFEDAFSEGAYTFPSLAALMVGRLPVDGNLLKPRKFRAEDIMLAERARAAGYRTYAYSESPFASRGMQFDRGFSDFDEAFPYTPRFATEQPRLSTAAAIARTLQWMDGNRQDPLFVYLHILRPHNPYSPPPPFLGRFGSSPERTGLGSTETLIGVQRGTRTLDPEELRQIMALYDENLAYGDYLFGTLWQGLRALDLDARTLIVVCSDHGEAFLEHGQILHGRTVYDEMTRIPLIIRDPRIRQPRRQSGLVQLTDVTATLVDIFGTVSGPPLYGRSLNPTVRDGEPPAPRPAFSWSNPTFDRWAIRSPRYKILLGQRPAGPPPSWFDLEKDPGEQVGLEVPPTFEAAMLLHHQRTIASSALRTRSAADSRWARGGGSSASTAEVLDEQVRERLRALGYSEDGS